MFAKITSLGLNVVLETIVDLFPPTAISYLYQRRELSIEGIGREVEPMIVFKLVLDCVFSRDTSTIQPRHPDPVRTPAVRTSGSHGACTDGTSGEETRQGARQEVRREPHEPKDRSGQYQQEGHVPEAVPERSGLRAFLAREADGRRVFHHHVPERTALPGAPGYHHEPTLVHRVAQSVHPRQSHHVNH